MKDEPDDKFKIDADDPEVNTDDDLKDAFLRLCLLREKLFEFVLLDSRLLSRLPP